MMIIVFNLKTQEMSVGWVSVLITTVILSPGKAGGDGSGERGGCGTGDGGRAGFGGGGDGGDGGTLEVSSGSVKACSEMEPNTPPWAITMILPALSVVATRVLSRKLP